MSFEDELDVPTFLRRRREDADDEDCAALFELLKMENERRERAENLRVLYVALTRARDRLVLGLCAERHLPVVVTLGGGYGDPMEDTLAVHENTVRALLETYGTAR